MVIMNSIGDLAARYWPLSFDLWIKIAIILIGSRLWRMSGSAKYNGHWHRCMALPILLAWYAMWNVEAASLSIQGMRDSWFIPPPNGWLFLLLLGCWQIVRVGYGIPDKTDTGSFLGRIFKFEEFTRAVAGILYSLPALWVLPLGVWWKYAWICFTIGFMCSLVKLYAPRYETFIGAGVASVVWFI